MHASPTVVDTPMGILRFIGEGFASLGQGFAALGEGLASIGQGFAGPPPKPLDRGSTIPRWDEIGDWQGGPYWKSDTDALRGDWERLNVPTPDQLRGKDAPASDP